MTGRLMKSDDRGFILEEYWIVLRKNFWLMILRVHKQKKLVCEWSKRCRVLAMVEVQKRSTSLFEDNLQNYLANRSVLLLFKIPMPKLKVGFWWWMVRVMNLQFPGAVSADLQLRYLLFIYGYARKPAAWWTWSDLCLLCIHDNSHRVGRLAMSDGYWKVRSRIPQPYYSSSA